MTRANGNRVVSFFACLLGLGLPSASVTGQVNGAIASPQENSAKPVRMRVSQNAPRATTQRPPVYPTAAIDQRIEGKVVLHVIIGGDGTVKESTALSGHPLLTQSAMEAVKQWQYRPMSLNGSLVEMDTTVTLDYALGPPPTVMVNNQTLPAFSPEAITLRQQQQPSLPAVDAATETDIRRLIEVTGIKSVVTAYFGSHLLGIRALLLKELPADVDREKVADRFQEELQKRIRSAQVLDAVIPIYAKHFTHEEIKSFLAFYDTPAGKRYAQEAPYIMLDISRAGASYWMNTVLPEIFKQMSAEFPGLSNMKPLQ